MFWVLILTFKKNDKRITGFILLCVLVMSFLTPLNAQEGKIASIYISYPIDIPSTKLETIIQNKCPEIDVKVFKKIRNFNRQVKNNKPDAIINLNQYSQIKGYEHFLQGFRNNRDNESYVLITKDETINTKNLNGKTIGVVDFIGKQSLSTTISEILKSDIEVESLYKNSHIPSTLLFRKVDAIFASEKTYLRQKSKTTLNLKKNNIDVSMKLASVSIKNKIKMKQIEQCIKKFDEKINDYMGVEQWK